MDIKNIFVSLENCIHEEGREFFLAFLEKRKTDSMPEVKDIPFDVTKTYLNMIIEYLDKLRSRLTVEATLISVKHHKLLSTCFQLIVSFGITPCLIPGLGLSITKRSAFASYLPLVNWSDLEKYDILRLCTDFITRSYILTAFKKIILTFHLSDYLASLIQLSFAPLKKPGTYLNFTMTQEMYEKCQLSQKQYEQIYQIVVRDTFQPILIKELFVIQGRNEPCPPKFVKKVVAKTLSSRLLAEDGLLSLIRCFIDSYDFDPGKEWKKIDMICKIVACKHGDTSTNQYLENICSQLGSILLSTNNYYLVAATACILRLDESYPQHIVIEHVMNRIFKTFDLGSLLSNALPATVILTPQEVHQSINILHACITTPSFVYPALLLPNLDVIFLMAVKCTNNEMVSTKLKDIILKCIELSNSDELAKLLQLILFGRNSLSNNLNISVEQYQGGMAIKCVTNTVGYPRNEILEYFIKLFKAFHSDTKSILAIFEECLQLLINISSKRESKLNKETLLSIDDEPALLDDNDEQYITVLQLLSEMSSLPPVINSLKENPEIVLKFIKHFISINNVKLNEECVTIALVLLNTILSNSEDHGGLTFFKDLIPVLKSMADNDTSLGLLCEEIISLIINEKSIKVETAFDKAVSDVYDSLLPVKAHGVISLTKLIDAKDPETISKKHYVLCLFQEQLKNTDSYLYLSAVNGIASLGTHCTEDVLHMLCNEYLQISIEKVNIDSKVENSIAEIRMKIGDIIMKITRGLGDMAIVHKTILLNTILCACRDPDPFIRTSALSNLAEIARVLHYRIGTIIYEVLHCVWSVVESEKVVECRRAAVLVISSLLKGLGKDTLIQLKENLLPIYRTLKEIYRDNKEDSVVRLHAQIALEELNSIVNEFLFPELKMEKKIFLLDNNVNNFE